MSEQRDVYVPVGRGIWVPRAPTIVSRVGHGNAPAYAYGSPTNASAQIGARTTAARPQARFGNPYGDGVGVDVGMTMRPRASAPPPAGGGEEAVIWRADELEDRYQGRGAGSTALTLPAGFRLGVWVDVGGANLRRHATAHADRLQALGIHDACIMINSHTGTTFGYGSTSEATLRAFAPQLTTRGISLTLTSWLRPDRTFIDAMLASLPDLARELEARAIEFDVEEPWMRASNLSGFSSHTDAANYLYDRLDALRDMGIEVGVTPQVDPMTSASLERIVQRAHFVVPQAYSSLNSSWLASDQARRDNAAHIRSHAVDGTYGPRGLQTRAAERLATVRRVSGAMPMMMGLSAYSRTRWSDAHEGGHSASDIMRMELERSLALVSTHGVLGVRYWSWKWIAGEDAADGGNANGYSSTFIDALS